MKFYNLPLNIEDQKELSWIILITASIFYIFSNTIAIILVLLCLTSIMLYLDISSKYKNTTRAWATKLYEAKGTYANPSHISLTLISALLTCCIFNKSLVITAWFTTSVTFFIIQQKALATKFNFAEDKAYNKFFIMFIMILFMSLLSTFTSPLKISFFTIIITSFVICLLNFFEKFHKLELEFAIPIIYASLTSLINQGTLEHADSIKLL